MNAAEIVSALKQKFGEAVLSTVVAHGEHTLNVTLAQVKNLLRYCRDEMDFDYLVDVSSLDNFGEEPRFEMVYEIYGYSPCAASPREGQGQRGPERADGERSVADG